MPALDRSQPYSDVIGIPGVAFEQHGRRFSPGGREVLVDWASDASGEICVVRDAPEPVAVVDDEPAPEGRGFEAMHWKQLKVLCETFEHPWVDKADAVAFLRGNG